MKFTDKASIGTVKRTKEGYLVTQARALRTGVQDYMAWEFGDMALHDGFGNHDVVRVFRPAESVFSKDSLKSAVHVPVTIDHPPVMVDSENYNEYAVGEVSTDVMRDGEMVAFSIMVKDKRGLDAVDGGKVQLSAGYTAEMTRVEHKDYDYVMGPPSYNHIAIVDKARAGNEARIGDNAAKPWGAAPINKTEKEIQVDMIKVRVGDSTVDVAVADADKITKIITDHAAELEDKDTKIAELKIEVADTAKLVKTDEQIAAMIADGVKEITAVTAKAAKLVDGYVADGKSAMEIRKEVITKVYGDEAIADLKTDAEIKAAFAVARVADKADPVLDARKEPAPQANVKDSQADYEARLANAWKGAK